MNEKILKVGEADSGKRLDVFVSAKFDDLSRQYVRKLIDGGFITVKGKKNKAGYKLRIDDSVKVKIPPQKKVELKPKKMDLDIVFEDNNLLVVNKPAGMVVHPGVGDVHTKDSLVNAILYHCKDSLSGIGGVLRPGIVHRLDKNTSGVIVVAKNDKVHSALVNQFQDRSVKKTYYALVAGKLVHKKGKINAPIGRDSIDRKKMAVTNEKKGKIAISKYEVVKYLGDYSYVKVNILTGRTHQIRVHFASIGHPVVGDEVYGKKKINEIFEEEYGLNRQFLHAGAILFEHPVTKKKMELKSGLPQDLRNALDGLEKSCN